PQRRKTSEAKDLRGERPQRRKTSEAKDLRGERPQRRKTSEAKDLRGERLSQEVIGRKPNSFEIIGGVFLIGIIML
ncbi:MAG: hypothetical protein IJ141_10845, partial [Lachnospiraceae bacterium]|nr:hypothetical protein [Lachnospiraceae bacterium]